MNDLLSNHVKDIDNTIEFLKKYKNLLNSDFKLSNNNVTGIFLLNNKIEELKDSILNIINTQHNKEIEPYLQKELDEHIDYMDTIKKMLPFLTVLFMNNSNLSLEAL
jgi:hypothetical protein